MQWQGREEAALERAVKNTSVGEEGPKLLGIT